MTHDFASTVRLAPEPPRIDAADSVLDNAAWYSLTGGHADLAEVHGRARRYPPDVSPFAALPDDADAAAWADLAALVGPGHDVAVAGGHVPPPSWITIAAGEGVQLVADTVAPAEDPRAVRLGPDDVAEMLALVERTKPGPFLARTIELGTYLGLRQDGRLVAMAGQRLNPTGWREISAVCTDLEFRGRGYGTRLVLAVAADIVGRGERPLMHAAASNVTAVRLYETLGFRLRRHTRFGLYRSPVA